MGTLWVREFTGGLDTRRLPETSKGGTLIKAIDGHINRGGEFEQRAAFVPFAKLPKGTVGMAYVPAGLVVFGSGGQPADLPANVIYQQLQHPSSNAKLTKVLSYDLFSGKLFVAAKFDDGSINQYYDGNVVTNYGSNSAIVPGNFVQTFGRKMYYLTGPNVIYSNLADPTNFDPDSGIIKSDGTVSTSTTDADGKTTTYTKTRKTNADGTITVTVKTDNPDGTSTTTTSVEQPASSGVGAGFNDLSEEDYGSENLVAIGRYQNYLAFFSDRTIQIRYMDPDPALSKAIQALHNTGTLSPRSVTQFGDSDLFYLDSSGLRSLRARDASNSAATSDIGSAIDVLLTQTVRASSADDVNGAIGLIEPRDGRFWLSLGSQIFVFSYFPAAKVSAWSIYNPGFHVDDMTVYERRAYVRSGDQIYVYGGLGEIATYDDTEAVAWLPFLDADTPTEEKAVQGIDAAVKGTWLIELGMEPARLEVSDKIGTITETTFSGNRIPAHHRATHMSLRFTSKGRPAGGGPCILGSAAVTFSAESDKAKA
jgi:hypothetical protein